MPGLMEMLQGLQGPGGSMGTSPMQGMDALAGLQQTPPPSKEMDALKEATNIAGVALSGAQMRSPKAAKLIADGVSKFQAAIQALSEEGQGPLGMPPNLGMQSGPMQPPMALPGAM